MINSSVKLLRHIVVSMLELLEDTGRLVTLDATIDEVLKAIEYIKHQRKLQHEKYRRLFVASTNPPGRPRKNPIKEPTPGDAPKRGRGRPKKQVPPPAIPEIDLPPPPASEDF